MAIIKHNISVAEAFDVAQEIAKQHGPQTFCFAGVVHDPIDDKLYRLASPVDVVTINPDSFEIALPELGLYTTWTVDLPPAGIQAQNAILAVPGQITTDNVWEFDDLDELPEIGDIAEVDADALWPEWSAEQRKLLAAGQCISPDGVTLPLHAVTLG